MLSAISLLLRFSIWLNYILVGSSFSLMNKIWELLRKPLLDVATLLFFPSADHEAPGRDAFALYEDNTGEQSQPAQKEWA